jgi:hypothetical protein
MFEVTNDISSYLAPNERILWQGRGRGRRSAASAVGVLMLAIFVGLAVLFVTLFAATTPSSHSQGDAVAAIVIPIVFVAAGLGVGLPLLLLGRRAGNARYLVTTISAVIAYPAGAWSGKRVTVIPLRNVSQLTLTENRDTTGTLTFGTSPQMFNARYSGSGWLDGMPAFWNIEQPMEVYQLIRRQMQDVSTG